MSQILSEAGHLAEQAADEVKSCCQISCHVPVTHFNPLTLYMLPPMVLGAVHVVEAFSKWPLSAQASDAYKRLKGAESDLDARTAAKQSSSDVVGAHKTTCSHAQQDLFCSGYMPSMD